MANNSINSANTGIPSQPSGSEGAQKSDLQELEKRVYERLRDSEKQADERQVRSVEVLGIFMAFLSFIAVNVQIFNRVSSAWSAGLFTLLMFCALAILVILMDIFLKGGIEIDKKKKGLWDRFMDLLKDYRMQMIVLFVLIGGISILSLRNFPLNPVPGTIEFDDAINKKIGEQIDAKFQNIYTQDQVNRIISSSSSETEDQIMELKECLKSGGWNKCF